jgi:hypothetical protein
MPVRSVPQVVLDEADDVLGELADWLRLTPYCPHCLALPGCSHDAGCPLSRVARLRRLLGSGDQQRRDDELAALRRERGELARSTGELQPPASPASALTSASAAIDVPAPTSVLIEVSAPAPSPVPSAHTLGDVASRGGHPDRDGPVDHDARGLAPGAPAQVEAVDDAQARAFVVETLQLAATRCFAEASALRGREDRAPAGAVRATAAALCDRAGRYAEAAAGWLIRNGADALLGQGALLRALAQHADPIAEREGSPR